MFTNDFINQLFKESFQQGEVTSAYAHLINGSLFYKLNVAGHTKNTIEVTTEIAESGKGVISISSANVGDITGIIKDVSHKVSVSAKYDVLNSKATVLDGILAITIPLKEESKPKKVTIGIE